MNQCSTRMVTIELCIVGSLDVFATLVWIILNKNRLEGRSLREIALIMDGEEDITIAIIRMEKLLAGISKKICESVNSVVIFINYTKVN